MNVHPKTLICTLAIMVKDAVEWKISDLFDSINEEIYEMGDVDTQLHLKINKWHTENDVSS